MYQDNIPSYPDNKMILGRYLGPATDIGLAHLGPASTVQDFSAKNLTPDPDHYDDNDPIDPDYGDTEITPEMGDNYLSAKIMLPHGGTMVKGCVAARKLNRDGNQLGSPTPTPF